MKDLTWFIPNIFICEINTKVEIIIVWRQQLKKKKKITWSFILRFWSVFSFSTKDYILKFTALCFKNHISIAFFCYVRFTKIDVFIVEVIHGLRTIKMIGYHLSNTDNLINLHVLLTFFITSINKKSIFQTEPSLIFLTTIIEML